MRATLSEPLEHPAKAVRCTACQHYCTIREGQSGVCGVRLNKQGELHLLVYGKASAVNIDPIEKKPLFHFLPGSKIFSIGTVGCNFSCSFCQNWDLSQAAKEVKLRMLRGRQEQREGEHDSRASKQEHPTTSIRDMAAEIGKFGIELAPQRIVELCLEQHIPSIAYTYNEPAIFAEYAHDTAKLAKQHGIRNVFVSNGYESHELLDHIGPYLDAMNIDLKGSDQFYQQLCHARQAPVLKTIHDAHARGIWIEVTTLVIPGKNTGDLAAIARHIASVSRDIPWHVTAFRPDYKLLDAPATTQEELLDAYATGKRAGLRFVYVGNIIDTKHSSTLCPACAKMLVERAGHAVKVTDGQDSTLLRKGVCSCGEKIPGVWQ